MIKPTLSIVIPTLNAATHVGETLAALRVTGDLSLAQILVVDSGSADDTCKIAQACGAEVLSAQRGRGRQLSAGASVASGEWLLFLHADTCLASEWSRAVSDFVSDAANADLAAAFCFRLDDNTSAARRLERLVAWRCSFFGLPYGDQGLLIRRSRYEEIGGYRPLAFLEDVDLVRRQGRRRITMLNAVATTWSVRYRRTGYFRQGLRNILLVILFFAGVTPDRLSRFYR